MSDLGGTANLAISVLASGTFVAIVNAAFQRRAVGAQTRKTDVEVEKLEAETAQLIEETSVGLRKQIKELDDQTATQRKELREVRERESALHLRVRRLESSLGRLEGHEAAWNAYADACDSALTALGGTPITRPRFGN